MATAEFVTRLGSEVQGKSGEVGVADIMRDNDFVGLYFSAHWCPPCRGFTPKLIEWYNKAKKEGKKIEIVFISSDRDEDSFNGYYGEMPWLALPYSEEGKKKKSAACTEFNVSGIPTFIVFNAKTGKQLEQKGRDMVQNNTYPQ